MADWNPRANELFLKAIQLDEAEREQYLAQACSSEADLRHAVETLLRAHHQAGEFLAQPPVGVTAEFSPGKASPGRMDSPSSETPGTIIAGRYKLLEEIGEGGMGTVWVAEQTEPVRRKVALKLIKPGMDSKSVLARFEAERQALAMMDHPNIAKVLDAGLTENRRPYFVMEYIKGLPLTKYCDDVKLSIEERLKLFIQICQAVQHAHQKGIIHRDLKPTNILIALYDGKPVPKVIDFGLAKALHQSLTERTLHTGHEMVLGTPLYMSPEQAELNNLDIDTRSDIYSLGVILYELLTGVTPLEKQRFQSAAWAEVLRIIKDEEPSKPSTKLSHSESLPSVAAQRQMEPKKLSSLVKGDLDWIVMKALAKERDRRYETANGFAMDIQRYLSDEPVSAGPPSARYRFRKFVQRNKGMVIAASLVAVALLTGVVGTSVGLYQANLARSAEARQRELAELKEREANNERSKAVVAAEQERQAKVREAARANGEKQAKDEAVRNLAFAKKGNELLGSVFAGLDPKKIAESGRPLQDVLRENLVKAVKELEGSAIGDPLEVAEMQNTLGVSLLGLGEAKLAVEVLEKAWDTRKTKLGPDHSLTLTSLHNLAEGYQEISQLDKALLLKEETLKLKKVSLGPDHVDTLASMNNLALGYRAAGQLDKALPLFEETLKLMRVKLGPDHLNTLSNMNNLADAYQAAGQLDKALPLFEETLKLMRAKLGTEHPTTIVCLNNLALGYQADGQLDKALPLFEENLKLTKAKLGPDHPSNLTCMNNLARGYLAAGRLDKALPLHEEALTLTKAKLGLDHPGTLTSMSNLAAAYREAGQLDKALPLYEEALKLKKAKLGPEHPSTLANMISLTTTYVQADQLDKALPLIEDTFKLTKVKLGPDHPYTLTSMSTLADVYQAAGQFEKALPLKEQTLRLRKAKLGPDHPDTLTSMNNLASCYWSMKKLDKSVPLFEELLIVAEKKLGRMHPETQNYVANLGVNYKDTGRLVEAIPLLEEAYRASKKLPRINWVGGQLLDAYAKAGKPVEAAKLIDELLADARKQLPKDSQHLSGMMAQFGMRLLEMKGYVEAEPLLRECLTIREKTQPDAWTTFNTQSMLGGALLGQKKYADAEPLLVKGYEGLKAREKTIPPQGSTRLPEALERLIQLYTETNKPDEVKKWQVEKAKLGNPPKGK